MSELKIFLVILLIGVAVCQGAFVPERSHRYPRSDCPMCDSVYSEELPEELSEELDYRDPSDSGDLPLDSLEQIPEDMVTRPAPLRSISRPQHPRARSNSPPTISRPFHPLMRAERSPPSEESAKKVLVVYRGDLKPQPTVPEAPQPSLINPLSDKHLEEIVTRAILSAKKQAEEQNSLYRPRLQNLNLKGHNEEYDMSHDDAMKQHMMHMRALGLREFPMMRDPYTVYGGVTDHWDGINWQKIGENSEEEHHVIGDTKGAVESEEAKKNGEELSDKSKEEMGVTQGKGTNVQDEKMVDPALVEDMKAPPTDEGDEELKTTTPGP